MSFGEPFTTGLFERKFVFRRGSCFFGKFTFSKWKLHIISIKMMIDYVNRLKELQEDRIKF